MTGKSKGSVVMIPRIKLIDDKTFPFHVARKQFPVKLAFCVTVSKSQGQSVEHVGLFLPQDVFGHGQLYVAFTRVTNPNNLSVLT